MLEQLARDDHVEARIGEVERLVEVGPVRLDAEARRRLERLTVGIDSDDVVAVEVRLRERPVAAAEIENAAPGAAHVPLEERFTLRPCEDEAGAALAAVVLRIALAELVEAHASRLVVRPAGGVD